MKRRYFFKKNTLSALKSLGLALRNLFSRTYALIFAKRTIVFVTNEKIRSVTMGPIVQASFILFFAWVGNLFIQSLYYDELLGEKSQEISKLKSANGYFGEEFEDVNVKIDKINEYLISVTGSSQKVKAIDSNFQDPKSFKEDDLSKRDKNTLNKIKEIENKLADIESIAQSRIKKIEDAILITGLNLKKIPQKSLNKKYSNYKNNNHLNSLGQGGPIRDHSAIDKALESSTLSYDDSLEREVAKIRFSGEFDYLMVLEKLAVSMPLSKPMRNYYISSGFGKRVDPMTRRIARHRGLDFVGSRREKIISPSGGKVILAGRFGDYGKAVVIDHGFGVTTRYGHLSKVLVKSGQIVKKGDVIARQGSTGRSTGPHLHYEVRYKKTALNPRKFLEAGEALFKEEKIAKYVNS